MISKMNYVMCPFRAFADLVLDQERADVVGSEVVRSVLDKVWTFFPRG
jgi:hypothetical protein